MGDDLDINDVVDDFNLSDFIRLYNEAHLKVSRFFDNSASKTRLWMTQKNALLGRMRPIEMLLLGRGDKLLSFIDGQLSENKPIAEKTNITDVKES